MNGWKMPTREDIISGTPIKLLDSDISIHFDFDYCVIQGACVYGGLIYLMAHNGGNPITYPAGIWIIDPILGKHLAIIPHQQKEPEGIVIYNGTLYWQGRTASPTAEIPSVIYKYEFNMTN